MNHLAIGGGEVGGWRVSGNDGATIQLRDDRGLLYSACVVRGGSLVWSASVTVYDDGGGARPPRKVRRYHKEFLLFDKAVKGCESKMGARRVSPDCGDLLQLRLFAV